MNGAWGWEAVGKGGFARWCDLFVLYGLCARGTGLVGHCWAMNGLDV